MSKRGRAIARNQLNWILNRAEANITYALEDQLKGNSSSEDVRFVKRFVYQYAYSMCMAYEATVRAFDLELTESEINTSVYHMFGLTTFVGDEDVIEEANERLETPEWDLEDDPVDE